MSDKTGIEWTDATWNPVAGCSIVSKGCTNCYAMKMAARIETMGTAPHYAGLTQPSKGGPVWTGKMAIAPEQILTQPMRWKKPRRIFVNSMSDLFHEGVPDAVIDRVFAVMALSPQHTFQVLTKRPERMRAYLQGDLEASNDDAHQPHQRILPLPNVWLGVSTEDQATADERIPLLLDTPAAVRFISAEPLLGPIDLTPEADKRLDWVIVGGESGPGARPMHPDWARSLRDQCEVADVSFLFKQWGEWCPPTPKTKFDTSLGRAGSPPAFIVSKTGTVHCFDSDQIVDGKVAVRLGKHAAGRLLDGVEHNGFPTPVGGSDA